MKFKCLEEFVAFVGLITLIITTRGIVSDANKNVSDAVAIIKKSEKTDYDLKSFATEPELKLLGEEVESNRIKLINMYTMISELKMVKKTKKIEELNKRIGELEAEIARLKAPLIQQENDKKQN